ncbi:uncharacterized protein DMAD_00602 [Drosophila madeirensis]|uniref:MD-2-related lipid-recognition domain-containing protein n=1 Tax=Drosophila madeirensis TaxID=30013 RepID=A0AAU9FZ35_DROMD
MYCTGLTVLTAFVCICQLAASLNAKAKSWTYTLQETSCRSSDESIIKAETRIERMGRGEFGLSGSLTLAVQLPEDMEVEVLAYRSTDGGANYKLQPYSLPRQSIYAAINSFYKDMIMESAANCSNLPQFKDKLTVVEPQKFTYEKCQVSTDAFPQYVPDGFYKINFVTYGLVEVVWELTLTVEKKTF